ncbi:hypothetical protein [Candidatus Amarolinea dominans]|uniref:hypothetical protein n=1 Tax=Candidatus Amarolinea dominans TaxID=3140696 RepID=UPI0031375E40|nr:PD40 domain-containing protein [Anaerolineae bacterium]
MPDEVTFCPHCGKQQLKLNTRFCHICGQPIPAAPALVPVAPAPVAPAPKEPRRPSAWWLLPLFLVGVVALVLLAWEPARSRVGDLLAGIRTDATEIAPPALARAVPGDATVGPTQIVSVTPTATPAASATGAIPPSATTLPTATLRPTATPSPTATLPPSATPTAAPPATSEKFLVVSLQGVVNAMITDGYIDPPLGDVVLSGVRFSLGQGGSVTTQAAPLTGNPQRISLSVDAPAPEAVYLLLTGGNLYSRFDGLTVGRVRLIFDDGKMHAVDLVAGHNLREWKQSGDVIGRTRSPELAEVWRGANRFDAGVAVIDMLRVSVPPELQSSRLVSVEVLDLSAETVGDLDPALNLLGVSVASKPGPTATPLLTATTAAPATPTPVVGKVVFGSDRNGFAHIFRVRGDGRSMTALTSGSEYFWDPIFSNDGTLVAFVSKVSGNTEVFVARSDGSSARPISNHPAEDDHPAWFPGNSELAFASRRDGGWEVYRMNADGSNVRRLTADGGDNRFVAVSPDGRQIAYLAQNAPYPGLDLMLMNADGSNRRALFSFASAKQRDDPGRYVFRPDWSPDGAQLAFGADDDNDGLISVFVVDAATGQARRLIEDGNSPAWSPDGGRLIYKSAGDPQILFVADASGRRLYQLTAATYNAWSPDWTR